MKSSLTSLAAVEQYKVIARSLNVPLDSILPSRLLADVAIVVESQDPQPEIAAVTELTVS